MISGSECDSNDLTSLSTATKIMPRKNEPIRNSLEPKKTLRCLRGMYMFLQKTEGETKTGIKAEGKELWPGFIL